MKLFESIGQKWQQKKQQMRLEHIRSELEQCQEDCANLGAHIGWLIQRKTELETEINRREA